MQIDINRILLATSVGLNLVFCAIVIIFLTKIPINLDAIRNDYLKDVRMFYHKGCLNGADVYPQEYKLNTVGFNENSPMNWCDKEANHLEEAFMEGLYRLGR